MIDLTKGAVDEINDLVHIESLYEKALSIYKYELLQYHNETGLDDLKKEYIKYLQVKERTFPEDIVVCNGGTAGLDLVSRAVLGNKYDSLVLEPAFNTAIEILKINSSSVHSVRLDQKNMFTDSTLKEIELKLKHKKVKLFYLNPTFNNPAGYVIPHSFRLKIINLCKKHSVTILEDDPYKLYNFDGVKIPKSFFSIDKDIVIQVHSLSKVFYPGFRIGCIIANNINLDKIKYIQKYTTSSANLQSQGIIRFAFEEGHVIRRFNEHYKKIETKREILKDYINSNSLIEFIVPEGGFYIWYKTKKYNDAKLYEMLYENGVKITTGSKYYVDKDVDEYIRISYSNADIQDIIKAISLLNTIDS